MGYKPKAAVYVQPDLKDGDHSYADLQGMIATELEAANKANAATWPKQNSLTAAEIKVLDGSNTIKGGIEGRNAVGQPTSLISKVPAGYKSSVSKLDSDGASKPVE